jgi:hypothetical protein
MYCKYQHRSLLQNARSVETSARRIATKSAKATFPPQRRHRDRLLEKQRDVIAPGECRQDKRRHGRAGGANGVGTRSLRIRTRRAAERQRTM